MRKSLLTTIILTYNESLHIERCIKSVQAISDRIIVVDSYSNDNTIEIALANGAEVYQNPFVNQAVQFNWALDNINISTEWIFRIDADEYVADQKLDLRDVLQNLDKDINGVIVSRKIIFFGQSLLHGGWYPKWNLRLFRVGYGRSENKWMDEHIVLSEGRTLQLKFDFIDDNLNDFTWWTNKHNNYSTREMIEYYVNIYQLNTSKVVSANFWGNEAERKRWLKEKYLNFPLFIRPLINFCYRYFILGGFLDGKQGFMWHFLQGFWYRFLVDAKIWELKRKFGGDREKIVGYLREKYSPPTP